MCPFGRGKTSKEPSHHSARVLERKKRKEEGREERGEGASEEDQEATTEETAAWNTRARRKRESILPKNLGKLLVSLSFRLVWLSFWLVVRIVFSEVKLREPIKAKVELARNREPFRHELTLHTWFEQPPNEKNRV